MPWRERLESRVLAALTARRNQVDQNRRQLQALGPEAVLARGFSYTLNASGKVVREAREERCEARSEEAARAEP